MTVDVEQGVITGAGGHDVPRPDLVEHGQSHLRQYSTGFRPPAQRLLNSMHDVFDPPNISVLQHVENEGDGAEPDWTRQTHHIDLVILSAHAAIPRAMRLAITVWINEGEDLADCLLQHISGQIANAPRLSHAPVKALNLI
jgi:hypothetical protein